MTAAALIGLIMQWGPVVISAASAAAAVVPPTTADSHPAFKVFSQAIDFLAINFGQAKK